MRGSRCRRWLETLTDVTMAVIPAFIKFFTKVLSFDFDLGLLPTPTLEESEAPAKDVHNIDQFPRCTSKSLDNSALLKAGSRVSMGMWLGRRVSSTSESSVRLYLLRSLNLCMRWYSTSGNDTLLCKVCCSKKYFFCAWILPNHAGTASGA